MSSSGKESARAGTSTPGAMITTPHWLASEAGAKVLRRGGNAIEVLVAAGAALSVAYPHFCGLGGDAVWLIADETGKAQTFLGIGQAANVIQEGDIPLRGAGSTLTSACLVDSWEKVLAHSATEWAGSESLPSLLDDAIALANDGFEVSRSQAFWHEFRRSELDGRASRISSGQQAFRGSWSLATRLTPSPAMAPANSMRAGLPGGSPRGLRKLARRTEMAARQLGGVRRLQMGTEATIVLLDTPGPGAAVREIARVVGGWKNGRRSFDNGKPRLHRPG